MKLREYRKKNKLTQQEVAKRLNIEQKTYSNYENRITEPNFDTLVKLSKLFNTSIDNLIKDETIESINNYPSFVKHLEIMKDIEKLNEYYLTKVETYVQAQLEAQNENANNHSNFKREDK